MIIEYNHLDGFEELTRKLTRRYSSDVCEIERIILGRPKFRRNIAPKLTDAFFCIAKLLNITDFFEIGVMNGRHTMIILDQAGWNVHSFEPNLYCFPSLVPLLDNERLRLLPFAVSSSSGFAKFNLPTKYLGRELHPMSGVSSLHLLDDDDAINFNLRQHTVYTVKGNDYISFNGIDPGRIALWIDTEGNSASVLQGFFPVLSKIPLIILEVEYGKIFSNSPNWNDVVSILQGAGFNIIGRDWQTLGACNILAVNANSVGDDIIEHCMHEYLEFVGQCQLL